MAVGSTRSVMASGERDCGSVCQALKITRLVREETKDLIKTYVSAQNCKTELFKSVYSSGIVKLLTCPQTSHSSIKKQRI